MRIRVPQSAGAVGLLTAVLTLASPAAARTTEVTLVVKVDLQRVHPNAPPDEPLEPAPAIAQTARELIEAHPAFRAVTLRFRNAATGPSPRVPADFLRLVDARVDDLVVVELSYHMRLDSLRAAGKAVIQGHVSVHSVVERRKVLTRPFAVVVSYPGEVSRESVIQAELAARGRGATVPVEEIEVRLLDAALKARLAPQLGAALDAYNPGSLPVLSRDGLQEGLRRLAGFLASAADRRDDAILTLEGYLKRFPDAPNRGQVEQRLRQVRQSASRGPGDQRSVPSDWAAIGISRAVTAKELAETFERLVGTRLEVWAFKLDWRDDAVVMTPTDKNQDFLVEGTPPAMRELEADPNPVYLFVVGRRADPRIPLIDVKIPVVRWLGCPKTACP